MDCWHPAPWHTHTHLHAHTHSSALLDWHLGMTFQTVRGSAVILRIVAGRAWMWLHFVHLGVCKCVWDCARVFGESVLDKPDACFGLLGANFYNNVYLFLFVFLYWSIWVYFTLSLRHTFYQLAYTHTLLHTETHTFTPFPSTYRIK